MQSASMATRFYEENDNGLRRRTRSPTPQLFSTDLVRRLHTFQDTLQTKLTGVNFEMEHVGANEAECIVTGITGSIEMLKRLQEHPFLFFVENGRVVIRYVPESPESEKTIEKTVIGVWFVLMVFTGLFIAFNLESYKNILM